MDHPLRAYRLREGLSQDELAARVGVTKATISRVESGQRPSFALVQRIVEATKGEVSANDFLTPHPTGAAVA